LEEVQAEQPLVLHAAQMRESLINRTTDMTEFEGKKLLQAYGIGVTHEALASSTEQAVQIACAMDFPGGDENPVAGHSAQDRSRWCADRRAR
jgi:acyl-CoA synthetase (NDP forming)